MVFVVLAFVLGGMVTFPFAFDYGKTVERAQAETRNADKAAEQGRKNAEEAFENWAIEQQKLEIMKEKQGKRRLNPPRASERLS